MTLRSLPIAWDHATGEIVLGLDPKTALRFEPSEENLIKLVRHLQGLAPIPQGQTYTSPELPKPGSKDYIQKFSFPQKAHGIKTTGGYLSREKLNNIVDKLLEEI